MLLAYARELFVYFFGFLFRYSLIKFSAILDLLVELEKEGCCCLFVVDLEAVITSY